MKRVSSCIGPVLLMALVVLTGGAQAATVDFWFAAQGDPTGTPITSIDVAPGATFNVSVWYQTDDSWAHNAMELLVGYDRATSQGAAAAPLDGQIALSGGAGNISFPIVLANNAGGGYNSTAGDRPYGAHLALGATLGTTVTALSAVRICDISLKNQAIPDGGYYDMTIWDATSGTYWTSYAVMMGALRRDGSMAALRVNSQAVVYTPVSIDGAKKAGDGLTVSLSGETVTARVIDTTGQIGFAVEETDRSSGIRIISSTAVVPGDIVTVQGALATVSGERVIDASAGSVTVTSIGNPVPKPLGTANLRSGGGTYGAQGAVVDAAPDRMSVGLNNVGILVNIWGKVTISNDTGNYDGYFYVDDGSNLQDGSGNIGVKCRPASGVTLPAKDAFVSVRGVMGVRQIGGINARYLWTTGFTNY